MTSREIILARFETLLEGIVSPNKFATVEINRPTPVDTRKASFPMAFIYSGREVTNKDKYNVDAYRWDINLEFWAKETDMEKLLPIINTAIYDDWLTANAAPVAGSLEDLLNGLNRYEVDFYDVDPTKELRGMAITYQVDHSPDLGTI